MHLPIFNLNHMYLKIKYATSAGFSGSTGASVPGSGVNTPSTSASAVPGTSRGANGSGGSGTSSLQQTQPPQQEFGHCPKARDGPALGCNYCWNSTDPTNGRILRRKTKYVVKSFEKYLKLCFSAAQEVTQIKNFISFFHHQVPLSWMSSQPLHCTLLPGLPWKLGKRKGSRIKAIVNDGKSLEFRF